MGPVSIQCENTTGGANKRERHQVDLALSNKGQEEGKKHLENFHLPSKWGKKTSKGGFQPSKFGGK